MARLNEAPMPVESIDSGTCRAILSLPAAMEADKKPVNEVKRRFIRQNRELAK